MASKNASFFSFLLLALCCLSLASAVSMNVSISESSTITKLSGGQYSLVADGILSVKNPSNTSMVYDFQAPFNFDALIGVNKISIDNSSSYFTFNSEKISGHIILPNQTVAVGYHIYGIVPYDLNTRLIIKNCSVLEYYTKGLFFSSQLTINLQKPEREGFEYIIQGNDLVRNTSPSVNTGRQVSALIRNQADFDFMINEIKIMKSLTSDPMFSDSSTVAIFENISLAPFQGQEVNFRDENSNESSVYWVSSLTYIVNKFDRKIQRSFLKQQKPASQGGAGGSDAYSPKLNLSSSVLLYKSVAKSLVTLGDEIKVTLQFVNVNENSVYNVSIYDEFPSEDFELKEVSQNVKILSKNQLIFSLSKIEGYGTIEVTYTLVNKKTSAGISYLKPARAIFKGGEVYSQGILIINGMLADKKVYIQKEVSYIDENYAKVIITVKNLGNIPLTEILVTDVFDDNSIIKDISQNFFERGVWKINELKAGEEWEVSYLVERNSKLDSIPSVFGVDKSQVFGTLISSDEVITIFQEEPKLTEKIGLGLAVGLLVFYLLF
jgi:hypothetical protein